MIIKSIVGWVFTPVPKPVPQIFLWKFSIFPLCPGASDSRQRAAKASGAQSVSPTRTAVGCSRACAMVVWPASVELGKDGEIYGLDDEWPESVEEHVTLL